VLVFLLAICWLTLGLICLWAYIQLVKRHKHPHLVKLKGVITISNTNLNPTLKTDLLAFGKFSDGSIRRLLSSEYAVNVVDSTDTEVIVEQGTTTLDHQVTVAGVATPIDVPIGSAIWQTPAEVNGVVLTAKYIAGTIEDDETYTFTGGQPTLVGLIGSAVQE